MVGQIRHCLSVSVARATSTYLLDRLHQVALGLVAANARREASSWQEETIRADREVGWSARLGRQNYKLNGLKENVKKNAVKLWTLSEQGGGLALSSVSVSLIQKFPTGVKTMIEK